VLSPARDLRGGAGRDPWAHRAAGRYSPSISARPQPGRAEGPEGSRCFGPDARARRWDRGCCGRG
jgi:hypothetical protein